MCNQHKPELVSLSLLPALLSLCIIEFDKLVALLYNTCTIRYSLHFTRYKTHVLVHSIHLFPHLLSHSSINELGALHGVKE